MADAHKNFARTSVATAPSPATSGTSLVVAAGEGALLPAVPFNATVWPVNVLPTTANAEVVRVTARSTDTLTITRAQESSVARSIVVGDTIAATITNKALTDIEHGVADVIFSPPTSGTAHVALQAIIATLSAGGGGVIKLESGTYQMGAAITVPTRVHIYGQGLTTLIQANASTVSTGVFKTEGEVTGTSSQWSVQNMRIENTGTAGGGGIGIDASNSSYVRLRNLRMVGWATGLKLDDTTNATFYSSFHELDIRDCLVGIDIAFAGTQPNDNNFYATRVRPLAANVNARGVRITDARGIGFFGLNCEAPGTASANGTGIELAATARDNVFHNVWVENNAVGVTITSGATRNSFIGGAVTSNTTDITDNGTATSWVNVNKTGTTQESYVRKDLYDANSVLIATADNTPINLTVAASRILGRKATGDIVAMSGAEAAALLSAADLPIADAGGYYGSDTVEDALQELGLGTEIDQLPGYTHQVAWDGGSGLVTITAVYLSHYSGAAYAIPADPEVGDQFVIESVGSAQMLAGANRDYSFVVRVGGVNAGIEKATGVVSNSTLRAWRVKATLTILSLGSSGTATCFTEAWLSDKNLGLTMNSGDSLNHTATADFHYFGMSMGYGTGLPGSINTTVTNAFDIGTFSSLAGGTQTITPMSISVTKRNSP